MALIPLQMPIVLYFSFSRLEVLARRMVISYRVQLIATVITPFQTKFNGAVAEHFTATTLIFMPNCCRLYSINGASDELVYANLTFAVILEPSVGFGNLLDGSKKCIKRIIIARQFLNCAARP